MSCRHPPPSAFGEDTYQPYFYNKEDMHELRSDQENTRYVLRGGAWPNRSIYLRAAYRLHYQPDMQSNGLGFRLARRPRPRNH
ncbi:MAG: SUMF1/EgtB/PvdO family nonheme iron enzyme [Oscillochloridaceae bacterium umkhey_bin13]